MIETGLVFLPPHTGTNKLTLEGYNHLTWRYKLIPYIRTDNCTDMSNMFSGANYSLPEILDLRAFNTSRVTTMRSMFDNCVSEKILGLDIFDTSNVDDMAFMFNASKATELDLSNFNTSKVTTMENMFCNSSVEDLDISGFDTSSVTNMSSMFENVGATFDVRNFDTSSVINMHNMFKGTSGTVLDLSGFNTSSVEDMSGMFQNTNYEEIDTSNFNTSNVTDMNRMYYDSTIEEIDISNFDMSNVENMSYMFSGTSPQTFILPNNLYVANVEDISYMFSDMTIDNLDLKGVDLTSASNRDYLFSSLNASVLDISDWDLGAGATIKRSNDHIIYEGLFYRANIQNLKLSNSNTFPESYNVAYMFSNFKTEGTLDLSGFNFYKATNYNSPMFSNSQIHTLILNIDQDSFSDDYQEFGLYQGLFNGSAIELLDMSNSVLDCREAECIFGGLTATRVNMPNKVYSNKTIRTGYYGKAKYVDYSSVDTTGADYTDEQWSALSNFSLLYNKIVWIPSTFKLNGEYTMSWLTGDVYTDALSYAELGWSEEPSNATMHYGMTHADFEQAILDDDPDEWVAPNGLPLFFCHTHVPLGSTMTMNQFNMDYGTVYLDGNVITEGYEFDTVGEYTLSVIVNGYEYKQKLTVDDHGSSYTVVGTPYDYTWNSSSRQYVSTVSTVIECRLYSDRYLFVYPIGKVQGTRTSYTSISNAPSTNITKVSGIPFSLNKFSCYGCTYLSDISELIVCSNSEAGFDPSLMFYNCRSLTDVSVIDKWIFNTSHQYYYAYSSYSITTRYSYYTCSSMFAYTGIVSAPKISIPAGSNYMFSYCTSLTDISKLKSLYIQENSTSFIGIFSGCSNLSNVGRLKDIMYSGDVSYSGFLQNTAITNTDFIPTTGLTVSNIDTMFSGCTHLTDISGMGRIKWYGLQQTFSNAFSNTSVTDFSPIANWEFSNGNPIRFTVIVMENCRMTNLSFMENWDLSSCTEYSFGACTYLTSISTLSGKIITSSDVRVNLYNCTALTSLVGLENVSFNTSSNFQNCSSLTSLNGLQGCTFKYATNLFSGCRSLTDITALSEVTFSSSITNINYMFSGCNALTSLDGLQGLDISNINQLVAVFQNCTSLTDLSAIANWNPYQVTNINSLFYGCSSITSFYVLRGWITAQMTNVINAFRGCSSLVTLDGLAGFNVGQCTSLAYLFQDDTSLTDITAISAWYVGNCTSFTYMFRGCTSLLSISPLRSWSVSKLTNMTYMFSGDTSITDADSLEDWKNVKTMTSVTRTYAFQNVPKPWPSWAVS